MADDYCYNVYMQMRQKLHIEYRGIDLTKVMAHDLGRVAFNQNSTNLIWEILYSFFLTINFLMLKNSIVHNKFVCIYSVDRTDYLDQIEQTFTDIESYEIWLLNKFPSQKYFRGFRIIKAIYFVLFRLGIEKFTLSQILFISSRIVYYQNLTDQLHKTFNYYDCSEKVFVAFNSAYTIENLMTQFFNQKGCQTFSLSHSFFVNYKKFIPLDIINGQCITSKKILVWGESSKNDLYTNFGVSKDMIEVVGNPKYGKKSIRIKNSFSKCIVILGRKIYEETNVEVINILKNFLKQEPSIKFELKLHLSLDSSFYEKLCLDTNITVIDGKQSLTELFKYKGYDFSIVNNSTAYYEAMYYDLICFRYEPSENENFIGLNDYFHNSISLSQKIMTFKTKNLEELNEQVNNLLGDTIGMGINRYKEVLNH
ncbi:hypothetical protein [Runella slithyformis]|uniref:Uncharacterized protein n=1 Tax=Runella slithyformis (strain ATCC 29530 / DSM 19594 / LMG 11500 / NCIMB 11436 / LSU 4) TaxID=761193 RepID=A0A7U3ZPK1_RUNSL|nr:hypothetical protein [Runella slithyformis]AEI51015.1 hypothetical protein Runsl_4696 [Runella slithyformis DSM 19594]